MLTYYCLNDDNTVCKVSRKEWHKQQKQLLENDKKNLWRDEIDGKVITTFFIGLGLSEYSSKLSIFTPLLFRTDIFEVPDLIYSEGYDSWQEAKKGHKEAIEWVKNEFTTFYR